MIMLLVPEEVVQHSLSNPASVQYFTFPHIHDCTHLYTTTHSKHKNTQKRTKIMQHTQYTDRVHTHTLALAHTLNIYTTMPSLHRILMCVSFNLIHMLALARTLHVYTAMQSLLKVLMCVSFTLCLFTFSNVCQ